VAPSRPPHLVVDPLHRPLQHARLEPQHPVLTAQQLELLQLCHHLLLQVGDQTLLALTEQHRGGLLLVLGLLQLWGVLRGLLLLLLVVRERLAGLLLWGLLLLVVREKPT